MTPTADQTLLPSFRFIGEFAKIDAMSGTGVSLER